MEEVKRSMVARIQGMSEGRITRVQEDFWAVKLFCMIL